MRGIVLAALAALLLIVPVATAAPPDAPTSCRIDRPDGLWNEDYVDLGTGPWDTHLHHGLNSNFNEHTRPIGRVREACVARTGSDRPLYDHRCRRCAWRSWCFAGMGIGSRGSERSMPTIRRTSGTTLLPVQVTR